MRGLILILLILAVFFGCTPQPSVPITAGPLMSGYAAVTLAHSVVMRDSPSPTPAPAPSGQCDNCKGTGRVGDGRVFVDCPVCGGDGRLDAMPVTSKPPGVSILEEGPKSTITMRKRVGCLPCAKWVAAEKAKLEDAGWVVIVETETDDAATVPNFDVLVGGNVIGRHTGYLTMDQLRKILEVRDGER